MLLAEILVHDLHGLEGCFRDEAGGDEIDLASDIFRPDALDVAPDVANFNQKAPSTRVRFGDRRLGRAAGCSREQQASVSEEARGTHRQAP